MTLHFSVAMELGMTLYVFDGPLDAAKLHDDVQRGNEPDLARLYKGCCEPSVGVSSAGTRFGKVENVMGGVAGST